MPERFKVVCTMQGAIQVLSFTFTFYKVSLCENFQRQSCSRIIPPSPSAIKYKQNIYFIGAFIFISNMKPLLYEQL